MRPTTNSSMLGEAMRGADQGRGFSASFKDWDVEALVDHYFFRPVAEVLVRVLDPLVFVRPNHLSVASVFAGLAAGGCYAQASPGPTAAGGLWLALSVVLDAADGQLARRRGIESEIGKLFDNVCDPLKAVPVILGIVIGMHRAGSWGDLPVPWGVPDLVAIWVLGCLAGITLPLQVVTRNAFVDRYHRIGKGKRAATMADLAQVRREFAAVSQTRGLWLEKLLVPLVLAFAGKGEAVSSPTQPGDPRYLARMRPFIRLWTFYGGAMQFAILVVCSLFGRPLWGFLYIAGLGMALYLPLLLTSASAHRRALAGV